MDQRNESNIAKEAMRNKGQNLSKTEQSVKTNLKMAPGLLKWKNSKLMKVAYISEDHTRKFADFFDFLQRLLREFVTDSNAVSAQQSKSSINFTIETLLGTKT